MQLRGRVQDLAADLQGAEEELAALEGLQEQLTAEVGADEHVKALVDAAVAREHAIQESRNRKVLDLLSSKVCRGTTQLSACHLQESSIIHCRQSGTHDVPTTSQSPLLEESKEGGTRQMALHVALLCSSMSATCCAGQLPHQV